LVVLGTISLLKERKFLLYTLTLFLAVASNYYIGFFVCIFVFLVFVCYQICRCRSVGRFFADLGLIAAFSALALGMTAMIFLPGLNALQSTQSSVNMFPEGFAMNIVPSELTKPAEEAWKAYKAAKEASEASFTLWLTAMKESVVPVLYGMRQVAGNMGGGIAHSLKEGLPNLFCGVGTIVFAFLFLTAKRIRVRDKICSVALLVLFMLSFLLRQLDYIWHGFHFTNMIPYRFSFLFSFVMVYMAYRAFRMRREFQLWQLIAAGGLSICLLLCSAQRTEPVFVVYNGMFLLLYLGLMVWDKWDGKLPEKMDAEGRQIYFQERKQRKKYVNIGLASVLALELVLNTVNFGVNFVFTATPNYPKGGQYTASMVRYMKEDDSDFYRAEVTHSQTLNDGALNGYSGISTFTSSANVRVTNFMQKLGFSAKNTYNRYTFEESSPVANLFLNLKYMLERDGNLEENPYFTQKHSYGDVTLLKNNAYLPLGFLAESKLAEYKFNIYGNNFAFQNHLFRRATGLNRDVWYIMPPKQLQIEPGNTGVTSMTNAGRVIYENAAEKTVVEFQYTIDREGLFCMDFSMSANNTFTVYRNEKLLFGESISLDQTMAISQVVPGDKVTVKVNCKPNENGVISVYTGILNDAVFQEGYEILAASTLDLTHFSNTRVEGTIDCNRDGLLYTSIPQDGNWSVQVDGKPVEPTLVGDVMLAVDLTEGTHTVCFTYENEAFELGWKISLISFGVLLAITVVVYRKKWIPYLQKYLRK